MSNRPAGLGLSVANSSQWEPKKKKKSEAAGASRQCWERQESTRGFPSHLPALLVLWSLSSTCLDSFFLSQGCTSRNLIPSKHLAGFCARGNVGAPIPGSQTLAVLTPLAHPARIPKDQKIILGCHSSLHQPESQAAGDLRKQRIKQELRKAGICN